jgi:molecular chaperone DnaK (HSP70)
VAAGAVLPTRESRVIATQRKNETSLEVELWEQTTPARPLGRWRLRDLPAAPAGDALAICNVTVDADGIPRLAATELVSGAAITTVALDDPGLDAATIDACRAAIAEWRP